MRRPKIFDISSLTDQDREMVGRYVDLGRRHEADARRGGAVLLALRRTPPEDRAVIAYVNEVIGPRLPQQAFTGIEEFVTMLGLEELLSERADRQVS